MCGFFFCLCFSILQVHSHSYGTSKDLLEPGELQHGGEDFPQVGGVLQRARYVETKRGTRALHAGEQIQRSHRILRAHSQETLR